jgi:hypothetical protein
MTVTLRVDDSVLVAVLIAALAFVDVRVVVVVAVDPYVYSLGRNACDNECNRIDVLVMDAVVNRSVPIAANRLKSLEVEPYCSLTINTLNDVN